VGKQAEQNLHLLAVVLDISDIVNQNGVEAVKALELALELEVPLGDEDLLDQKRAGGEQRT
jgi:hypothetical protein